MASSASEDFSGSDSSAVGSSQLDQARSRHTARRVHPYSARRSLQEGLTPESIQLAQDSPRLMSPAASTIGDGPILSPSQQPPLSSRPRSSPARTPPARKSAQPESAGAGTATPQAGSTAQPAPFPTTTTTPRRSPRLLQQRARDGDTSCGGSASVEANLYRLVVSPRQAIPSVSARRQGKRWGYLLWRAPHLAISSRSFGRNIASACGEERSKLTVSNLSSSQTGASAEPVASNFKVSAGICFCSSFPALENSTNGPIAFSFRISSRFIASDANDRSASAAACWTTASTSTRGSRSSRCRRRSRSTRGSRTASSSTATWCRRRRRRSTRRASASRTASGCAEKAGEGLLSR
ncbi:unnamed protein product [Phytophthora lilii]|uniref:Unnamed protein product n=1 Tax=Phytophthora lilii TaxID=2077276 RepID=A0A9W6XJ27_9STRA|nr:unnamed protein product [Phytophthora lilii]